MGDQSKIEWTGATWNPTTGCDRISPEMGVTPDTEVTRIEWRYLDGAG